MRPLFLHVLLALAACSEAPRRPGSEGGPVADGRLADRQRAELTRDPNGARREAGAVDRAVLDSADAQTPEAALPACLSYLSGAQESSPVQKTGALLGGKLLPAGQSAIVWGRPTLSPDTKVPFAGTPGLLASHEGVDYVIGASGPSEVPIRAAANGVVVYVRLGCPQACSGDPQGMFCHQPVTGVRPPVRSPTRGARARRRAGSSPGAGSRSGA